jgi:hypothetical protein
MFYEEMKMPQQRQPGTQIKIRVKDVCLNVPDPDKKPDPSDLCFPDPDL